MSGKVELELDHKTITRLPDTIEFSRRDRSIMARRVQLGEIRVSGHTLRIADVMYEGEGRNEQPPLPVRAPNGLHPVYAYQWDHPDRIINVCAVVAFRAQSWALGRRLVVRNEWRPDLTHGVIVDNGQLSLWSETAVTFEAGLGDGVYPIIGVFNFGFFPQAVVIDLMLWRDESHRIILLPGQYLDEFGIVRRVAEPGPA